MARTHFGAHVLGFVVMLLATAPALRAKGPEARVSVSPGTQINVRVKDKLRSDGSKAGDQFRGRLETPITVNGQVLYPKGTEVAGYVVRAHASGGDADPGVLELDLMAIGEGVNMTSLSARTLVLKGELHRKSKASVMTATPAEDRKDSRVESNAVLTWVAGQAGGVQDWSQNAPRDVRRGTGTPFRIIGHEQSAEPKPVETPKYAFSERDRRTLRKCMAARRPHATPPAMAKQVQKGRPLPAGLQKKVQPLPAVCSQQLSPVPQEWARVMVSGRVMLLDPGRRIADVFVF